jgi:hypothetical protein
VGNINAMRSQVAKTLSSTRFILLLLFLLTYILTNHRSTYPYTSGYDEHTHLSYVQYAHDLIIPAPGYSMNTWAKQAFSCHPHAIFGKMTEVKCGDILEGYGYPTGGSNTSEAWPPLSFIAIGQLMRIYEPFIEDPLFAARASAALLWSLGITLIGYSLLKRRIYPYLVLLTGLLITSLPVSANYSSFVSPYAMTPILVGVFLMITLRQIGTIDGDYVPFTLKRSAMFLLASILSVFTIPQFLLGVAIFGLAVFGEEVSRCIRNRSFTPKESCLSIFVPIATVFASKFAFDAWPRIQAIRSVPYPADVRISMGNVDPPEIVYQSLSSLIEQRFFSFWPNALTMGYPSAGSMFLLVSFWITLLAGLSYINALGMRRFGRWSVLSFSLVVAATIFSVALEIQIATPTPIRYGFTVVVIGSLLLADEKLIRPRSIAMILTSVLVAVTLYLSFKMPPLYTEVGKCTIGIDRLISCDSVDANMRLPWN